MKSNLMNCAIAWLEIGYRKPSPIALDHNTNTESMAQRIHLECEV